MSASRSASVSGLRPQIEERRAAVKCAECGKSNPEQYAFCVECGAHLGSAPAAPGFERENAARSVASGAESSRSGPPAVARLRVESGPVDQPDFALDQPEVTIGRRVGNDIVIQDTNVSRQHARVLRQDGGYAIEDTNSANGTVVNDERVEGIQPIHDGDVILIGDARFVFQTGLTRSPLEETRAVPMELGSGSSAPGQEPPVAANVEVDPTDGWLRPPPPIMVRARRESVQDEVGDGEAAPSPSETVEPEPSEDRPREAVRLASKTNGHGSRGLAAIGVGLAEVARDVRATQAGLDGLVERLTALEGQLHHVRDEIEPLEDLARGPLAQTLRDLDGLLDEVGTIDRRPGIRELTQTLEELGRQPRDIELLRQLSEHAGSLNDLLRLQGRLAALGPDAHEVLKRILE